VAFSLERNVDIVTVLGAGLMGRALAYDLSFQENLEEIRIVDLSEKSLEEAKKLAPSPKVKFLKADFCDKLTLREILTGSTLAIGATDYRFNATFTEMCIEYGVHFLDLGSTDEITESQFGLSHKAKEKSVTVIPGCGLAPGLAGILGMHIFKKFETCEEIHLRIGGLPQNPVPPLNYSILFNVKGLISEYKEPARTIEHGKMKIVPALSGLERIDFPQPFGAMEAFYTSGGISTLVKTLEGKVKFLDYKTIRYPGHQEKICFLKTMGFFDEEKTRFGISPREMTEDVLYRKLSPPAKDVTLLKIWGNGKTTGSRFRRIFQCIDSFDERTTLSSMMRLTAFPTAIIANMVLSGKIAERGVLRQEEVVPVSALLSELEKRNVEINEETFEIADWQ